MVKRVRHCILTAVICAIIAAMMALAFPHEADAIPVVWRGTPRFTQNGITYRVKGWSAVVVKTRGKRVNIPAEVKYHGKWYEVKAIWSTVLKGAMTVTVHANLETCEAPRLWSPKVTVRVTRLRMWLWLLLTGANVSKIHCDGCK